MNIVTKAVASLVVAGLAACGGPSVPAPVSTAPPAGTGIGTSAAASDPPFVNKFWITTTPGMALGSMVLFLSDRTMLMTSCVETYRLTKWDFSGDRMRWIEESIPIEAVFTMPRSNELRLAIAGQDRVQAYQLSQVPYVCPGQK